MSVKTGLVLVFKLVCLKCNALYYRNTREHLYVFMFLVFVLRRKQDTTPVVVGVQDQVLRNTTQVSVDQQMQFIPTGSCILVLQTQISV